MAKLRVILWDHLTHSLPIIEEADPNQDIFFFAEVKEQTHHVPHHKKKLVFLLSAMRHFAASLKQEGYQVHYVTLDDPQNTQTIAGEITRFLKGRSMSGVLVTEPSDYHMLQEMRSLEASYSVGILEDQRFITSHEEFERWAWGKKSLVMEYFYRENRKKTGFLMNGKEPEGGHWNYDKENRKPLKKDMFIPSPQQFTPDAITQEVMTLVEEHCADHFGLLENFWFGVTREQAFEALAYFCEHALPFFGDYQDAMAEGEPFLFHSLLSHYLNAGLLGAWEICEQVEACYKRGHVSINAAEGYIRQIIGWREYIRGIYWMHMPGYVDRNALEAKRPLPDFYWTGKTSMKCLSQAVTMTREEAYSHHIQRLMVTGNFALLAGLDPQAVHEWYLAVYADAYEWVESPNTIGMSLFADGGVVGTKPYIASGAYINRMSNFCKTCPYDVKDKFGEKACPFNFLYWDFLMRHEERFKDNHRMGIAYKNLQKLEMKDREILQAKAKSFLDGLES